MTRTEALHSFTLEVEESTGTDHEHLVFKRGPLKVDCVIRRSEFATRLVINESTSLKH